MNNGTTSKLSLKHQQEILIARQFAKLGDYDYVSKFIEANCSTISASEAKELNFNTTSSGILFVGENYQLHFKPDKPKSSKGKLLKYITATNDTGYDALTPVYPDNTNFWIMLDDLKKSCYEINGKPFIIVTEGEFKSLALNIIGYPCIALLGVEMGLTSSKLDPQGKRFLVPTLEMFAKEGFNFLLAFDSDIVTNKNVSKALNKLAHQITKFDRDVYILSNWDSNLGKGVDDYIINNGIESFRENLLHKATQWESNTIDNTGNKDKSIDDYSKEIADKYKATLKYCKSFGAWLCYESDCKGMWAIIDDIEVKQIIRNHEKAINHPKIVNAIFDFLKQDLYIKDWCERTDLLPFKDCVIDIKMGKVLSHSASHNLTWQLPRYYLDKANKHESISNWLLESTHNREHLEILECFLAASLRQMIYLQKALHLIGPGGSGKSTFMDLATSLIGSENAESTSFELIGKPVYRVNLLNKRLINFADQPSKIQNVDIFKSLTGQDTLSGDRKFKDPVQFKAAGLCLITSNDPLFFGSSAGWLKRRMITIPFTNVPKKKRNLMIEFASELASYTRYLLSIPIETIENTLLGYALNSTFIESQIRTDPLMAWLNDCIVFGDNYKQLIGDDKDADKNSYLFSNYHQYCKQTNRMGSLTHRNFSEKLIECCQTIGKPIEKRKREKGATIIGLTLRLESHFDIPTIEEALIDSENSLIEKNDSSTVRNDSSPDSLNAHGTKLLTDMTDNTTIHADEKNKYDDSDKKNDSARDICQINCHNHQELSTTSDSTVSLTVIPDSSNSHFRNKPIFDGDSDNENKVPVIATNDDLKSPSNLSVTTIFNIGDEIIDSEGRRGIITEKLSDDYYGVERLINGKVTWTGYDAIETKLIPKNSQPIECNYLDSNGDKLSLSDNVLIKHNPIQPYSIIALLPNNVIKIRTSYVALPGKGQKVHDVQEILSTWVVKIK